LEQAVNLEEMRRNLSSGAFGARQINELHLIQFERELRLGAGTRRHRRVPAIYLKLGLFCLPLSTRAPTLPAANAGRVKSWLRKSAKSLRELRAGSHVPSEYAIQSALKD